MKQNSWEHEKDEQFIGLVEAVAVVGAEGSETWMPGDIAC